MGNFRFKIDLLTIVLLIGIATLYGFSHNVRESLKGQSVVLKQFQSFKDIVHLPDSSSSIIFPYDHHFDLFFSVNGGDTYNLNNAITPADVSIINLNNRAISVRTKPVNGKQPELKSFLVKAKHKSKPVYCEPKLVTFFNDSQHTLPILNIVTSERGLFSDLSGVMTLGIDSWTENAYYKPFWHRKANYKRRGGKSKRKAIWQLIENGELIFESKSDFQIGGNATRSFPQKSFKLKANRLYGNSTFKYHFFGKKGLKQYQSLVVRNSGNDNTKTLFADLLMHQLARETNVMIQDGKPLVVYINGNYWGIYNIRERIDTYMIAHKEGVKVDKVTILEGGAGLLKDGNTKLAESFVKLINGLSIGSEKANYKSLEKQIDLNSLIDYMILETYYGNGDWLHNNAIWYKAGKKKWKWILNDLDYGMAYLGKQNLHKDYFKYLAASSTINARLFNFLIGIPEFKELFKERASFVLQTYFSDSQIESTMNHLKSSLETEIDNHLNRWRGVLTKELWENNIEENYNFLVERKAVYLQQLEDL